MKLLTFRAGDVRNIGALMGEYVIDLNAAFDAHIGGAFGGANEDFCFDMLSFLDTGARGMDEARKVLMEASKLKGDDMRVLCKEGVLNRLDEVRVEAPIPRPRKNAVCLGLN